MVQARIAKTSNVSATSEQIVKHKVRRLPPLDKNVNHAPHVVILGAGASIAAYLGWGRTGPRLPSMQDLIEVLSLRTEIQNAGYKTDCLNFEAFYDDLSSGMNKELIKIIESRVYEYFNSLTLPSVPTLYDYLVLSLREKDLIATFNWDPFLLQAYMRNEVVTKKRRPRIAFLHGNVKVAVCKKCKVAGIAGRRCSRCSGQLEPSKLLYPVKRKNYSDDPFIKSEWDVLRKRLGNAYFLTIFGYSAPKTDVEARSLMLDVWKDNATLELAEVDVIDVKPREKLMRTWSDFFFSHHYGIEKDIFNSYIFMHPRRSCDAFAGASLRCAPWDDNRFPRFKTLSELQQWIAPLIEEEELYESERKDFSGNPLAPNVKTEL
jgi:hypothetical protein